MGIAGIPRYPRVFRSNGVEHGGNTQGMELAVTVLPCGPTYADLFPILQISKSPQNPSSSSSS